MLCQFMQRIHVIQLKQMLFLETTAQMFTKKRIKSGHAQQFVYQYT